MERNLQLLTAGYAIRTFGAAIYNPFLALFLYEILHVSYLDIGIIIVGLGVFQLPFGYVGGLWTDRVGRRPLILLSLGTEAIFTAALAYGFEIRSLALCIAVAAVGGAILAATGAAFSAYIADLTQGSNRTLGFTWYRIGFNAGFAAGVAVGGTLVGFVGFVETVVVAAVIIAVAGTFVLATLAPSPFDVALRQGRAPTTDPSQPTTAPRSLRESFRLLVNDRTALLVAFAMGLVALTSNQWNVTFSLFVHNKLGISYAVLGIGLAINGLVVVFGQSFTTHRVLGVRHTTIAILGGAFYIVAYLLLGVAALWMIVPVALFFGAVIILTFGENLESIPQSTLPSNLAPTGEVGSYNGAFGMFFNAAAVGATFFGGAVLQYIGNPLLEWVLLVLPAIPGAILLRLLARRIPAEADRA
jgi:DHA1 family multidrug resistance protein-like MFS transporter